MSDISDLRNLIRWKAKYWRAQAMMYKASKTPTAHSRRLAIELKKLMSKPPSPDFLLRVGPPIRKKEELQEGQTKMEDEDTRPTKPISKLSLSSAYSDLDEIEILFRTAWTAYLIGPPGSPYEGGVWEIDIFIGQENGTLILIKARYD